MCSLFLARWCLCMFVCLVCDFSHPPSPSLNTYPRFPSIPLTSRPDSAHAPGSLPSHLAPLSGHREEKKSKPRMLHQNLRREGRSG